MNEYVVEITETRQKQFLVTADSPLDAEQVARHLFNNGTFELTPDDRPGVQFECIRQI